MYVLRNEKLTNVVDLLKDNKLNRSYDGEFSSWDQMFNYVKSLDELRVHGIVLEGRGCVLYFYNPKTQYTELGVYVRPEFRGQGISKMLFGMMEQNGLVYNMLPKGRDTVMQSPTDRWAKEFLDWDGTKVNNI